MNLAVQDADDLARSSATPATGPEPLRGYSKRRLATACAAQQFSNSLLELVDV